MKLVFLFLTLSIAVLALAVFIVPVRLRIQLLLNPSRTLTSVSLGLVNGVIWFRVYQAHDIRQPAEDGEGERILSALEELIRHPENLSELLIRFISWIVRSKPRRDPAEDKHGTAEKPRDRFIEPIIIQTLKRGLDVARLRIQLHFGSGDAATTGVAVGLIHALFGTAVAVFSKRLRFPDDLPEITVVPCYSQVLFDLALDFIVLFRPRDIVFQAVFGQN